MKLRAWMYLLIAVIAFVNPFNPVASAQNAPVLVNPAAVDEQIALDIYRAFYEDPRVVSVFTRVEVNNGVATLSGSVQDEPARKFAEVIARGIPGVTAVVNQLGVSLPEPVHTDDQIYRNVRRMIANDPQVGRYRLQVGVINGRVYLSGPVDNVFARAKIGNLARLVPGVAGVDNGLRVSSDSGFGFYDPTGSVYPRAKPPSDAEIKAGIEDKIAASPLCEPNTINVDVQRRIATLTGRISTGIERQALIHYAYAAGAREVRDNLVVVAPPPEEPALAPTGRIEE
jgi:osmotically-inducible protein OsmY